MIQTSVTVRNVGWDIKAVAAYKSEGEFIADYTDISNTLYPNTTETEVIKILEEVWVEVEKRLPAKEITPETTSGEESEAHSTL